MRNTLFNKVFGGFKFSLDGSIIETPDDLGFIDNTLSKKQKADRKKKIQLWIEKGIISHAQTQKGKDKILDEGTKIG